MIAAPDPCSVAAAKASDDRELYRKNDPNCCPTGGFDHIRWHWNGTRFAAARSWHTKRFEP